jgi:predicted phosphoadenosine phosphosulfate sulfurtransferase
VLDPWNPEKEAKWIRNKHDKAIKEITWDVKDVGASKMSAQGIKMYGFVSLIKCMEEMFKDRKGEIAQIIGLRADESLNRFRAVTKNPGVEGIAWSTKRRYSYNFYPIYDWRFSDVWAYLGKNDLPYNKIYDLFYWKGINPNRMRLANLIHTSSYECLNLLQEFEPETVDKMLDRVPGVATAQEYAGRAGGIYKANKLPEKFKSWLEFRNYLLDTLPNREHAELFKKRFEKQYTNDYVVKQQVNRILITDIYGYKPIMNKEYDPSIKVREKWMEML